MKKTNALFFSFILTLLIFVNIFYFSQTTPTKEKVIISRVIDGDTLELKDGRIIRLANINSPEKNIPNSNLSKQFLQTLEDKQIEMEIVKEADKYGRVLARIYSSDKYINLKLVKLGLASKFLVDEKEKKLFSKEETLAIKNRLGIWQESPYFGCFEILIDEAEEYLKIKNKCKSINVKSWIIKDESRELLFLPDIVLGEITVYSLKGKNNKTAIFWNNNGPIWNNDRDTLYFFDDQWRIVEHEEYGY